MIPQVVYQARRERLMSALQSIGGVVYLEGRDPPERSPQIHYEGRQNSHIFYLTGISQPGVSVLLRPHDGKYILFVPESTPDTEIWTGKLPSLEEMKDAYMAHEVISRQLAENHMALYRSSMIHSLPGLNGRFPSYRSSDLAPLMVEMRLRKSAEEIAEIENAIRVTAEAFETAMRLTRPGKTELEIKAAVEYVFRSRGASAANIPIVTMDGNILHMRGSSNVLKDGRLLLIDTGADLDGYCADITRTFPVNGDFTDEQRAVYETVRRSKDKAIEYMVPDISYLDIHFLAEREIVEGLRDIGILKGPADDIMRNGAHRLFFPHGLGHPVGMDMHDLGDLENLAGYGGYDGGIQRDSRFGLRSLRFGRKLEPGFVLTVEPGVYFIPALLNNPKKYGPHEGFIDLERSRSLISEISGIRLEDDVLVTGSRPRILGPSIPEKPEDLKLLVGAGKSGLIE